MHALMREVVDARLARLECRLRHVDEMAALLESEQHVVAVERAELLAHWAQAAAQRK